MKYINFLIIGILMLNLVSYPGLAADNESSAGLDKSTGLFGDWKVFFKSLPAQVQYLVTFVLSLLLLVFVVMFFANLFASGSVAHAGAITGNASLRNTGTTGIIMGLGIGILVVIAVALFLFIF